MMTDAFYRRASPDKVLCNGYKKTDPGGVVAGADAAAVAVWVAMSEEEADALIAANLQKKEADADELET